MGGQGGPQGGQGGPQGAFGSPGSMPPGGMPPFGQHGPVPQNSTVFDPKLYPPPQSDPMERMVTKNLTNDVKTCPIPILDNGQARTSVEPSDSKVPVGTVAKLVCRPGFLLHGSSETVCVGGEWFPGVGTCTFPNSELSTLFNKLAVAVQQENMQQVSELLPPLLLDKSSRTFLFDNPNGKLLIMAVRTKSLPMVHLLMQRGATLETVDFQTGFTPFTAACHWGAIEVVKYFMHINGDLANQVDVAGRTPLMAATIGDQLPIVVLLGKHVQSNSSSVQFHNIQDERFGKTALHYAAENGFIAISRYLLTRGASTRIQDSKGMMPHHLAAQNGHWREVQLLFERDMDLLDLVAAKAGSAMAIATTNCHPKVVRLLVEQFHMEPDGLCDVPHGRTCLMLSAMNNCTSVAGYLLSKGADVRRVDNEGKNSEILAVENGQNEMFNFLSSFFSSTTTQPMTTAASTVRTFVFFLQFKF